MTTIPPSNKRQKTDKPSSSEDRAKEVVEWRLYHPKRQKSFQCGDSVLILPPNSSSTNNKDVNNNNTNHHHPRRGTVIAVEKHKIQVSIKLMEQSSSDDDRQSQETITLSKREWKRLIPSFATTSTTTRRILITPDTSFFRQLAYQTNPNDKLLEIGCSSGETSRLLLTLADSWVGLDTSDEMIAKCREKMEEATSNDKNNNNNNNSKKCHVAKADALVDPANALKEATTFGDPTVVFLDIGGNRECINVVRMLSWVLDTFPSSSCRLIVVKSRELVQTIRSSATTTLRDDDNVILNGNQWFLEHKEKRAFPKHPLRAPLVMSPKDDGKTPICRYHNYHKRGCSKGDRCELDHEHCHACQQLGHSAKDCPTFSKSKDAI
jgi:SAM-dependent methyltransferase